MLEKYRMLQQENEGVEPSIEASSVLTPSERLIPSPRETPIHRYCTDTNVAHNGTMPSHIASSYSSWLGVLLNLAQRSSRDREIEKQSKLKVA
jgi:hypothetical protein